LKEVISDAQKANPKEVIKMVDDYKKIEAQIVELNKSEPI